MKKFKVKRKNKTENPTSTISINIPHLIPISKKELICEICKATMDLYKLSRFKKNAIEVYNLYVDMSMGGNGGIVKKEYQETLREMHFKNWTNNDFKELTKKIKEEMEKFEEEQK